MVFAVDVNFKGSRAKGPRGQGAKGPRGQGAKGPRGQGKNLKPL